MNKYSGLVKDDNELAMAYWYYGYAKWEFQGWEQGCNDIATAINLGWGTAYGYDLPEVVKRNLKYKRCK